MRILKSLSIVAALIAAPLAAQSTPPLAGPVSAPVAGAVITPDARTLWFSEMKVAPRVSPGPLQYASELLARGRYADADHVLDGVRNATQTNGGLLQLRVLKGVAALGQNDAETARRLFKRAASMRRSGHPGALAGLALAELQMGDDAAEQRIRDRLQTRSDACDGACPSSRALEVVDKALAKGA